LTSSSSQNVPREKKGQAIGQKGIEYVMLPMIYECYFQPLTSGSDPQIHNTVQITQTL